MPSVSGASGSSEASQVQNQQQTEDIAAQKKLDAAQLDQQTAQQNDQAQQLMGQQSAQQSMLPQQVAGQDGGPSQATSAAQRLQGPEEAAAVKNVVGTVMAALAGAMGSMGSSQSNAGGGGDEQQSGGDGQRMGSNSSAMANFGSTSLDDQSQQRIKEAATVEVYQGLSDMLNTMQGRRQAKENIGQGISMYTQILSKKWEGTKAVPTFEFDEKTGQMKKTGMKQMTHEEATAERDKWKDKKDSISEMGEMDMLMLQQMMDKKTQLEQMISNVMKAGFEGGQAAISALKAS